MDTECPRCGAPIEWRIFQDGDGDPGVPGGTRSWTDAEPTKVNCACELTAEEWDALTEQVIRDSWDAVPSWADY